MTGFDKLYPELHAAGGLRPVLRALLPTVVLEPPFSAPGGPRHPDTSVGARAGDRSINVALGAVQRVFVGEFWEAGVCLGWFQGGVLAEVARLFEDWLRTGIPASRLASTADIRVEVKPCALAHEEGPEAYHGPPPPGTSPARRGRWTAE